MIAPIHPDVVRSLALRFPRPSVPAVAVTPIDPFKDAHLDEVERAYVATVMSVMTTPAFKHVRERVRNGEIALAIEGDEVTWVDADQAADAIAREAAAPPLSKTQAAIQRLIQEASAAAAVLSNVASRLEGTIQSPGQCTPPDRIIAVACAEWGVKPSEVISKRRTRPVAEARHAIIVMLGRIGMPDHRIGELMNRDTSTLCMARRAVRRRLANDLEFAARFSRASALVVGTASQPNPTEAR